MGANHRLLISSIARMFVACTGAGLIAGCATTSDQIVSGSKKPLRTTPLIIEQMNGAYVFCVDDCPRPSIKTLHSTASPLTLAAMAAPAIDSKPLPAQTTSGQVQPVAAADTARTTAGARDAKTADKALKVAGKPTQDADSSAATASRMMVYFAAGSPSLGPEGRDRVTALAQVAGDDKVITLTGRVTTDAPSEADIKLALSRCLAVKYALVAQGVAKERIKIIPPDIKAYWATNPAAPSNRSVGVGLRS